MQLVVTKHGASLKVRDGQFVVRFGEEQQLIPLSKVRSIVLGKSCVISGEAIAQAVERDISIVFEDRTGRPFARIWSHKYGSISVIRKNQLAFSRSGLAGDWIREMLAAKIDNQRALLVSLNRQDFSTEVYIQKCAERMEGLKNKILETGGGLQEVADQLRAWEGNSSRIYFECISYHLPEVYQFKKRTKHPAEDMFNCLLNYLYGMLYNLVEGALIKAGLDPYVGVLHADEYNKPVLVYDVIEIFRVWADFVAVDLCQQRVVFKEYFDIQNGAWYLNPAGKRIIIQSFNDYLDENITLNRLQRTRRTHIRLFAERLAERMKNIANI